MAREEKTSFGRRLMRLALRLSRALGEECLLIGAGALSVWGHVRATRDIDFVTRLPPAKIRKRLAAAGIASLVRRGGPLEGDPPWVVCGTLEGFRFDVLPPVVPLDWERAVTVPLAEGKAIKAVDLDGLIRLKLRAGGPQDLLDVAVLLRQHPDHVPAARALAEAYGIWRQVEAWINDPRLRAEEGRGRKTKASEALPPPLRKGPGRKK